MAILNSSNAHNFPFFQPILLILVSKFMLHRALSDKTYLSLGLLSPLMHVESIDECLLWAQLEQSAMLWPALINNCLETNFSLLLSGRLRQVLLYFSFQILHIVALRAKTAHIQKERFNLSPISVNCERASELYG